MRLIDADKLIKQRRFIVAEAEGLCGDVVWVRDIQGAPTIDAVEQSDLLEALAAAEQRGYNKGLTDGLKDAAAIIAKRGWIYDKA